MDKLSWWEALATPDDGALKKIQAGRLKGKSDINPQWRYLAMTRLFGPCGVGWKFEIVRQWTEPGADGEVLAFVNVNVYVRTPEGQWSDPIPGTGGNTLVVKERSGMHNNDEAFKMATTDALGTAMKMLGVAAEVYMGGFDSKYDRGATQEYQPPPPRDAAAKSRELKETFIALLKVATSPHAVEKIKKDLGQKRSQLTPNDWEEVVEVGKRVVDAFRQTEGL